MEIYNVLCVIVNLPDSDLYDPRNFNGQYSNFSLWKDYLPPTSGWSRCKTSYLNVSHRIVFYDVYLRHTSGFYDVHGSQVVDSVDYDSERPYYNSVVSISTYNLNSCANIIFVHFVSLTFDYKVRRVEVVTLPRFYLFSTFRVVSIFIFNV